MSNNGNEKTGLLRNNGLLSADPNRRTFVKQAAAAGLAGALLP